MVRELRGQRMRIADCTVADGRLRLQPAYSLHIAKVAEDERARAGGGLHDYSISAHLALLPEGSKYMARARKRA